MNFNNKIDNELSFGWNEFFKSYTATRYGINNYTNDPTILSNIKDLTINVLQPLRNHFGPLRISSGYRCKELNLKVGGSTTSRHSVGMAADILPVNDNVPLIDILEYIHLNLKYIELIAEFFPDGWVHVAYSKKSNNKIIKLKDKTHNFSRVSLEYIKNLY